MLYNKNIKRKFRRGVALMLLCTMLSEAISPGVAYALTAGPTAPEATSFEPIDTTDMVNPSTGDFTYSLPLIEVPGPEGGYPLALSYHAGIQPNEEASWVGLGWSLNPGAIARNVNGYPDDWQNQNSVTRSYWSGGKTSILTVGVNIGIAGNVASVGAQLSFAQDTYRGFGVGYELNAGAALGWGTNTVTGKPNNISPFSAGVRVGVTPYGDYYAGANLQFSGTTGLTGLKYSVGIGASTNAGAGFSAGLRSGQFSLLGASISTSGGGVQLSVGGGAASSINNANAGKISTESSGWSLTIPTPGVSISLGRRHTRYWSDESALASVNGVLYNHSAISHISDMDNAADDNYQIVDIYHQNIVDNPDPSRQPGGTYPDFDNYSVTAQGLSGYMRPYIFNTALFNQNKVNNSDHNNDIKAEALTDIQSNYNTKWQFRFINDFSNSYTQESPYSSGSYSLQHYDFGSVAYGNNDGTYGYEPSTNRLEGSKHIEYFTNDQILSGAAANRGFIDCQSSTGGFTRPSGSQIGGFMITNASGVTYHYALPAYESNEDIYTQKTSSNPNSVSYNDLHKNGSYAYTWYLTAVTGPDYVSRGTAGSIDPSDWGYWVKFDYGKWTDKYNWRNPSQGTNADLDNGFKTFSSGQKEIYYLDAIETRSHTALFEKEIRADGKSLTGLASKDAQDPAFYTTSQNPCSYPKASLRLKSIFLIQNDHMPDNINNIRKYDNGANPVYSFTKSCSPNTPVHHGENVFDVNDNISYFIANCTKRIVFNHDYSLTPNTPNSYDPAGTSTYINNPATPVNYLGKLTLKSLDYQGKQAQSLTPPIQFQYDLDPTSPVNQGTISVTQSSANDPGKNQPGTVSVSTPGKFATGDILKFTVNSSDYYCLLKSTADGGSSYSVLFLNNAPPSGSTNLAAVKTKNPPYNKDSYDLWGCYKPDYIYSNNENLSRVTTPLSNKSTDVWSLRKIVSSLGSSITVNYEGDSYNRSVLNRNRSMIINSVVRNNPNIYTLTLNTEGLDLTTIYKPGDIISMIYGAYYNGVGYVRNTDSTRVMPPSIRYGSPPPSSGAIANWYSAQPVVTSVTANQVQVTVGPTDEENLYGYYHKNNYSGMNFRTGNMIVNGSTEYSGGGLRVKDITVDDLEGHINRTSYNYSLPAFQGGVSNSSGVTAYEPLIFDADNTANFNFSPEEKSAYLKELYKYHNRMLAIAREMPAPGVIYEYVTVENSAVLPSGRVVPVDGKTMYQFEVFRPEMIGVKVYNYSGPVPQNSAIRLNGAENVNVRNSIKNNIAIKDYTSRIGNLRRTVTYDDLGNKLSEKINHYLHDDLNNTSFQNQIDTYEPRLTGFHNQGVVQERYGNAQLVVSGLNAQTNQIANYDDVYTMSNKETYPAIQTGTTQVDYKNGTRTEQSNLAFDFYSGLVTKTLNTDSYGNRFISQVTPAYLAGNGTTAAYPALGLKTHDDVSADQHKQMLSQQASSYTFAVDAANNPIGVVTASVQTWSPYFVILDPDGIPTSDGQTNIWRPLATFNWMPTGSSANNVTPYGSFTDYFANGGSSNTAWKQTGLITSYNVYSAALEGHDINNVYAATHMGYNNTKVTLTGTAAKYGDLAFAGAEDASLSNGLFSGNIGLGGGSVDASNSHTGVKSLLVPAGQNGFTYMVKAPAAQNYSVAVWVKPTAGNSGQASLYYRFNGGTIVRPGQTLTKTAGGWTLLEMLVPGSAFTQNGNLEIGCTNGSSSTLYFDDFRVQPTESSTTAYVYDKDTGELTYMLDNNNLFIRYQYDAIGRLVRVYKEVLGKATAPLVKNISYNYARQN